MSEMALRPMLAATMMSSCLQLLPAATAFAVATVIGFVHLTNSSGVAILRVTSTLCRACTNHSVKTGQQWYNFLASTVEPLMSNPHGAESKHKKSDNQRSWKNPFYKNRTPSTLAERHANKTNTAVMCVQRKPSSVVEWSATIAIQARQQWQRWAVNYVQRKLKIAIAFSCGSHDRDPLFLWDDHNLQGRQADVGYERFYCIPFHGTVSHLSTLAAQAWCAFQ